MYALIGYYGQDIHVIEKNEDENILFEKLLDIKADYDRTNLFHETSPLIYVFCNHILNVYDSWLSKRLERPNAIYKICKI